MTTESCRVHENRRALSPEEDSVGDPGDADDEIDDLMPADLWFRTSRSTRTPAERDAQ